MATRRTLKVARVIKEVVSRVLMFELGDPRVGFVTVTDVDVSDDMRNATVRISVMGEPKKAELCLKAVDHARSHIQHEVASNLTTKTVPRLTFQLDDTVKKSVEISRLIHLAIDEDTARQQETGRLDDSQGDPEEQAE
ncbi:MAG: 30S ribosome-binding factor RbfA [Planctomycetes bacterium]|nr:30S ribosome-binding factor RbfA [Planctomycetota bacterium]